MEDESRGRTRDPVIEKYKADVDRSLLRENLKLTPSQRLAKHESARALILDLREAAIRARRSK